MEIAAIILSVMSLMSSLSCLVWMLAKHFSSHTVQLQPMSDVFDNLKMGKPMDDFAEIDDPLNKDFFNIKD